MNDAMTPSRPGTEPAPVSQPIERPWMPLSGLRDEMDRLLMSFWRGLPPTAVGEPPAGWPGSFAAVDIAEDDKAFTLSMELPGMSKDQVELDLNGDVLTLHGEKREQREDKSASYTLSERRYGSFRRSFQLPAGVNRDAIAARFDKGVLTVTLPKSPEAQRRSRRIEVQAAG